MGQKLSCCLCCRRKASSRFRKQKNTPGLYHLRTGETETTETILITSLQHISEREVVAEVDTDPSACPTAGPLFVSKSQRTLTTPEQARRSQVDLFQHRPLKKSSSCSTIFIDDCTVSHPNMKSMLKCVALAIYYHVSKKPNASKMVIDIFDERMYSGMPSFSNEVPDFKVIYRFMRLLFNAASLSSECAIITLVYLERLLSYAEIDILPFTWRRILLAALLLASKVWDDQAVWNVDYCQILRDITIDDMNELERRFLELLQFNINVPSSVYAKYYFELRNLADHNDLTFPAEPLSELRAQKLEAMSRVGEVNMINLRHNLKRSSSYDSIPFHRKSAAILS